MIRRVFRGVLAALVVLVLTYVTANVTLNLSPLRESVASAVERESGARVEVGYFFLNWKLQPVMDSMSISTRTDPGDPPRTTTELHHLALLMDWSRFLGRQRAELRDYVREIHVRSADVRQRVGEDGGGGSAPEFDFDFSVSVESWRFVLHRDAERLFRVAGEDLIYSGFDRPVETSITGYQDQPAQGRLTLRRHPSGWSARALMERLSFSNDVWQLHGDEWSGEFQFDGTADTPVLDVSLAGTPGLVGGVELPAMNLRSRVYFAENEVSVEEFSTSSDYFHSSLTGAIRAGEDELDLDGEFTFDLKNHLNDVLSARFDRRLEVRDARSLTGTLTINGSLSEPDPGGVLELPGARLLVETRGGTSVVELEELRGTLEHGRLNLLGGRLRENTKSFELENGFVEVEDGRVTISLTGPMTMNPNEAPPGALYPGRSRHLRSVRDVTLPMNFSGTFGPRTVEAVLAVRDGTFRYGPGGFEQARFLYTYSTGTSAEDSLRASVVDPDGNRWSISGPAGGPYTVEGQPETVDRWIRFYVPDLPETFVPRFAGVGFRGNFEAFDDLARSRFRVVTGEGATIGLGGNTIPVRGGIDGDSAGLLLDEVRLGSDDRRLTADGRVRPDSPLGRSELDVTLAARGFPVRRLLPGYSTLEGTYLSGDLVGTGPVRNPSVRGSVNFDTFRYRFLEARDLGFEVDHGDTGTVLSEADGRMNGGTVTGNVRLSGLREFEADGEVRDANLASLFPRGSWMNRHSSGSLTTSFRVRGTPGELGSLNGKLRGRFNQLILDYFPRIEGIEQIARPEVLENPVVIDPFEFTAPVRDGRVILRGVNLKSPGMRLNINGNIDLEGDVDLTLDLVLKDEALRGFLQDVFGEVYRRVGIGNKNELTIPLEVRGDVESPRLIVRRSEVNTNFRKNLVENFLSQPIGKPINELLDEIFLVD